ncbi:MAG: amidohydrolase family protein [Eubacteriales bacterium]|nr:amidohydrolase family protein [Eubacteriales bacterium]
MFDLIIKNGTIVDGTGRKSFIADIAIQNDKIAKIQPAIKDGAHKLIDVKNKLVCPGFIDPHSHIEESLLWAKDNTSYLSQGVTTQIGGNCGVSPVPLGKYWLSFISNIGNRIQNLVGYYQLFLPDNLSSKEMVEFYNKTFDIEISYENFTEYRSSIERIGIGTNVLMLIGHGSLRKYVMGTDVFRKATESEIAKMQNILDQYLTEGAIGFSTGLDYAPGAFASTEEIIALAKVVRKHNKMYTSHVRAKSIYIGGGSDDTMVSGIREAIQIARETDVKLHISHIDYGNYNFEEVKEMLIQAKEEGVDLTCDVISSASAGGIGYTYLLGFLKPWYLTAGSIDQFTKNISDSDYIEFMIRDMKNNAWFLTNDDKMTTLPHSLKVLKCNDEKFAYKYIIQIMGENNWNFQEALINIIKADVYTRVKFGRADNETDTAMRRKWFECEFAMPCSDSSAANAKSEHGGEFPLNELPHANSFNAYIKYLLFYGPNEIEQKIRKATGDVAERFMIRKRGKLIEGNYADIIVIDQNKLDLNENPDDPRAYPHGIETVIVNGKIVIHKEHPLNPISGRFLIN